jgi:UDP-glucose 4-epimerase
MRCAVTGAAGFIGSNLVDRLLDAKHEVVGFDNLSTGHRRFLEGALAHPGFSFREVDLFDPIALDGGLEGTDHLFHLAANADVRDGLEHPRKDLEQNTIVTWNLLEAMRRARVKRITFTSTGSVYGEAQVIPTPELCPFPVQTSLYGASKLAAEGLISAYAEGYGMQATLLRLVSVLGERYTHGHVFDFVRRLRSDPKNIHVLGNGRQRKSYLHVSDFVTAILHLAGLERSTAVEIYNVGTDEYVSVDESLDVICDELNVMPLRTYAGGDRGWVGDNPFIFLDCGKLRAARWTPRVSIRDGVRLTVRYLVANPWVFDTSRKTS